MQRDRAHHQTAIFRSFVDTYILGVYRRDELVSVDPRLGAIAGPRIAETASAWDLGNQLPVKRGYREDFDELVKKLSESSQVIPLRAHRFPER